MTTLPPVPGVVQVRLKGTFGPQPFNNILYLQFSGAAPTVADLTTVGTAVGNAWGTSLAPLCATGIDLAAIDLADLSSPAAAQTSVAAAKPGTRTGGFITAATCCVVSWKINVRYRGGHPRTYFPFGVTTDLSSVRLWTTAFTTLVQTNINTFRTALNAITASGATYKMVAVSRVANNVQRPTPLVFPIQSNLVHGRVDTQRRRLGRETP